MMTLTDLRTWYDGRRAKIRSDYFQFLRFPSISTDPAYKSDMRACASWLSEYFVKGGIQSRLIETDMYPIVYAEDLSAGPKAKTLLIYGHYDVQPVDPIELWKSPPFEPEERGGQIFARGAVDDKGQIFYAALAALCWKDLGRSLPVNLKFCIEGEEESQSIGLTKALPKLKNLMRADYLLIPDFDQFNPTTPAISLGARGIAALEVTLKGSNSDLHSGLLGGIAYNPNRALVELLAKLWDKDGRVQVKGFYDQVEAPSKEELKRYTFPNDKAYYTKALGIGAFGGEKGRSLQEANWFRPTLEINGISGGYAGAGMKTVIPSSATAKITCRLVPNQDPEKILQSLASFLKEQALPGMQVRVETFSSDPAFRSSPDSLIAKAVAKAAMECTGSACKNILAGGSIPVIANLVEETGAEAVGMGYGLIDDNIHAPDEHFDMERLEKGFLTVGRALAFL
jgi:acetylornithine deacetylase/succinyl-diaminopimelate desuccinylase-like protein